MIFSKHQIVKALNAYQRKQFNVADFSGFRRAAVLILLFPFESELHVLFTVRTKDVETHKGQVSFPGGVQDASDIDVIQTALRETAEELGLNTDAIEILGIIDDYPVITKFIVSPVIAYTEHLPVCSENPVEVEEVFHAPLSFFADSKNAWSQEIERDKAKTTVWFYQYDKYLIWGATAAMLRNLISVISRY